MQVVNPADPPKNALMLGLAVLAGLAFVAGQRPPNLGTALLWSAGCFAPGFLLGFLFGIPPVIQQAEIADKSRPRLGVNTNLNQIGDWLTKMLVGVTLVQLGDLPKRIADAAYFISGGIGGQQFVSLGGAILIYFVSTGFLSGYVWAVLHFGKDFRQAVAETAGLFDKVAQTIRETPLAVAEAPARKLAQAVRPLEGDAAVAARKMVEVPLGKVPNNAGALEAWARAHFDQRNYDEAALGYAKAVALDPANARLRHHYAIALKYQGAPLAKVVDELRQAAASSLGGDAQVRADVVASLTFNELYLTPPDSFTTAIADAEKYLATLPPELSAAVWVNLACAYGQEARRMDIEGRSAEQFAPIRAKALDAIRTALRVDPHCRERLAALLEPSQDQAGQGEDDLAVFRDDPEFRAVLGLATPPKA